MFVCVSFVRSFVCRLFVCSFVSLFLCFFVSLFLCFFVCLFVCLFVSLFVCLFVCLLAFLLVCVFFACLFVSYCVKYPLFSHTYSVILCTLHVILPSTLMYFGSSHGSLW